MLTWSALINVHKVRDITEELDSCGGTSMSFMRRGSDLRATLVLDCRARFQVRGTLLDPRPNLESAHRTRHSWLKRSLFCPLQPQDEGPYMHMDLVDEFASMPQWLTDSFATDPQDLSVLLPRQKQCHLQIRTSRFGAGGHRSSRLDGREPSHTSLLHSAERAARSCNGCPMFPKSAMVLHTSRFSENVEKWIVPDFSGPVSCLVHVPPDTMLGILKNAVSLRCTCDIDWTTLDGCLVRHHEANNKYDAAPVCTSSWLNAFSDDDTQV